MGNFSEGGSGGFFFLSPDRRYLIKTLTRAEQKVLLRMLPKYYEYLRTSPRTLLCRFYGCYAITMHGQTVCVCALARQPSPAHARSQAPRRTQRSPPPGLPYMAGVLRRHGVALPLGRADP